MTALAARVLATLRRRRLLAHGTRVLAAVSGGADSVALAHLLAELSAAGALQLVAVAHFDHCLPRRRIGARCELLPRPRWRARRALRRRGRGRGGRGEAQEDVDREHRPRSSLRVSRARAGIRETRRPSWPLPTRLTIRPRRCCCDCSAVPARAASAGFLLRADRVIRPLIDLAHARISPSALRTGTVRGWRTRQTRTARFPATGSATSCCRSRRAAMADLTARLARSADLVRADDEALEAMTTAAAARGGEPVD